MGSSDLENAKKEKQLYLWIFGFAFFLFSLWDVYIQEIGIRPLDFLGFFLIILMISFRLLVPKKLFTFRNPLLLYVLFSLSVVYCIFGISKAPETLKTCLGFLGGVGIFIFFYSIDVKQEYILRIINYCLIVHAVYLYIQWSYFFFSGGEVLNLYAKLGAEPRALSSIFRPTGLFLEPASYSVSILMLLILRNKINSRVDLIGLITIVSLYLTVSTWGVIATTIFLVFSYWNRPLFWAFIVIFGLALTLLLGVPVIDDFAETSLLYHRIENIDQDASAQVRYSGLIDLKENLDKLDLWIGHGVSNDYLDFGSNGLSFLVNAIGILGSLIFLGIFFIVAQPENRFRTVFFLIICMTAAPIWTNFFWWSWLGLLLHDFKKFVPSPIKIVDYSLK